MHRSLLYIVESFKEDKHIFLDCQLLGLQAFILLFSFIITTISTPQNFIILKLYDIHGYCSPCES